MTKSLMDTTSHHVAEQPTHCTKTDMLKNFLSYTQQTGTHRLHSRARVYRVQRNSHLTKKHLCHLRHHHDHLHRHHPHHHHKHHPLNLDLALRGASLKQHMWRQCTTRELLRLVSARMFPKKAPDDDAASNTVPNMCTHPPLINGLSGDLLD